MHTEFRCDNYKIRWDDLAYLEYNIKTDLRNTGRHGMEWVNLAQDREQW
jgi:hypothetical protein